MSVPNVKPSISCNILVWQTEPDLLIQIKSKELYLTWSLLVLPKKTSSAIEAGDSEEEDPVPLGASGCTLSWALGGPQG